MGRQAHRNLTPSAENWLQEQSRHARIIDAFGSVPLDQDVGAQGNEQNDMTYISPQQFVEAFKHAWSDRVKRDPDTIAATWADYPGWTRLMLDEEDGLLADIMHRLNTPERGLEYRREYYTLDALYVGGADLYGSYKGYPSDLCTLIEHENGSNVEEEMWKLIFWRSPLKVIIFYDWDERDKTTDNRSMWADNKIAKLLAMLERANQFINESSETRYLFIIGNHGEADDLPCWRYATDTHPKLTPLAGSRESMKIKPIHV